MNKKLQTILTGMMFTCITSGLNAQSSCYQNPSVEGPSQAHVVPAPWQACYGSPDTQPGQWGITQAPSNGNSYVSFLHSGNSSNGYNEGMTQLLVPCMVAGQTYTFNVDLAHTNTYNTASPGNCYSSLIVYGGATACAQTQVLWTSGAFTHTNWQTYTVTFTPTGNWCYLSFSPYYINACSGYINCMLDNITCIVPANALADGTDITCNGACNGSVWAVPTAGTAPYTFSWQPGGGTNDTLYNQCPGTYTVTVTDANNQVVTDTVTIVEPPAINFTINFANATCNNLANGHADIVNVTGGTGAYTYSWAPGGQTTASITGLGPGQYVGTVTDANGCQVSQTVTITQPPVLTAPTATTDILCFGQCTGSATVTPTGGTGPYNPIWSSGGNTVIESNLCAGTYTVNITDSYSCAASATVTITEPPQLTVNAAGLDATCNGACNGQLIAIPAGGTGAYSYAWSNGCNVPNCNGVCAGNYTLIVTDANGCTTNGAATVNEPTAIQLLINTVTSTCGLPNGSADVTPSGGTPGYTYLWSTGGTNATEPNLPAGNVCVLVTDANGCYDTICVTVPTTPSVTMNTTQTNVSCFGGATGSATVNITSGVGPYGINWTPGNLTTNTISNLVAGQYVVTVTDANSCANTSTVTITEPPQLTVTPGAGPTICNGQPANITANANGGVGPYNYGWNPGALVGASVTVQPSATTTYTVGVVDANGCSATNTVTVTVDPLPTPSFTSSQQTGCEPLVVNFTDQSSVSSGSISSWLWDLGNNNTSTQQNPTGTYTISGTYTVTLTVTTAAGCTQTITMPNYITAYPTPTAAFIFGPQPTTVVNSTISFTDQSTLAAQWLWDFGDPTDVNNSSTQQNPSHTYRDSGTYCTKLMVTSTFGCVDSTEHCLAIDPEFTFFVPNAFTPNGDGKNETFAGMGSYITKYEMWIFDRWGNLIWYTDDLYTPWDGKVQGGSEVCQQDAYVWKVKLEDIHAKKHSYIGHVSLIK